MNKNLVRYIALFLVSCLILSHTEGLAAGPVLAGLTPSSQILFTDQALSPREAVFPLLEIVGIYPKVEIPSFVARAIEPDPSVPQLRRFLRTFHEWDPEIAAGWHAAVAEFWDTYFIPTFVADHANPTLKHWAGTIAFHLPMLYVIVHALTSAWDSPAAMDWGALGLSIAGAGLANILLHGLNDTLSVALTQWAKSWEGRWPLGAKILHALAPAFLVKKTRRKTSSRVVKIAAPAAVTAPAGPIPFRETWEFEQRWRAFAAKVEDLNRELDGLKAMLREEKITATRKRDRMQAEKTLNDIATVLKDHALSEEKLKRLQEATLMPMPTDVENVALAFSFLKGKPLSAKRLYPTVDADGSLYYRVSMVPWIPRGKNREALFKLHSQAAWLERYRLLDAHGRDVHAMALQSQIPEGDLIAAFSRHPVLGPRLLEIWQSTRQDLQARVMQHLVADLRAVASSDVLAPLTHEMEDFLHTLFRGNGVEYDEYQNLRQLELLTVILEEEDRKAEPHDPGPAQAALMDARPSLEALVASIKTPGLRHYLEAKLEAERETPKPSVARPVRGAKRRLGASDAAQQIQDGLRRTHDLAMRRMGLAARIYNRFLKLHPDGEGRRIVASYRGYTIIHVGSTDAETNPAMPSHQAARNPWTERDMLATSGLEHSLGTLIAIPVRHVPDAGALLHQSLLGEELVDLPSYSRTKAAQIEDMLGRLQHVPIPGSERPLLIVFYPLQNDRLVKALEVHLKEGRPKRMLFIAQPGERSSLIATHDGVTLQLEQARSDQAGMLLTWRMIERLLQDNATVFLDVQNIEHRLSLQSHDRPGPSGRDASAAIIDVRGRLLLNQEHFEKDRDVAAANLKEAISLEKTGRQVLQEGFHRDAKTHYGSAIEASQEAARKANELLSSPLAHHHPSIIEEASGIVNETGGLIQSLERRIAILDFLESLKPHEGSLPVAGERTLRSVRDALKERGDISEEEFGLLKELHDRVVLSPDALRSVVPWDRLGILIGKGVSQVFGFQFYIHFSQNHPRLAPWLGGSVLMAILFTARWARSRWAPHIRRLFQRSNSRLRESA